MPTKPLIGRNVKLEVAATYGTAKAITAITKANPAQVTSSAHGLTVNTIGYLTDLVGCDEINLMAMSVGNPLTNTFELTGVDSTNFVSAATAGNFTPVLTWNTLTTATSISVSDASATQINTTTLLDVVGQSETGILAAQTVTMEQLIPSISSAGLSFIENAALTSTDCVFRATFASGARIIWRGVPSLPGMNVAIDSAVTGSVTTNVRGRVLRLV
jgi:hypothetical protein